MIFSFGSGVWGARWEALRSHFISIQVDFSGMGIGKRYELGAGEGSWMENFYSFLSEFLRSYLNGFSWRNLSVLGNENWILFCHFTLKEFWWNLIYEFYHKVLTLKCINSVKTKRQKWWNSKFWNSKKPLEIMKFIQIYIMRS
jgi:hypothetical protein